MMRERCFLIEKCTLLWGGGTRQLIFEAFKVWEHRSSILLNDSCSVWIILFQKFKSVRKTEISNDSEVMLPPPLAEAKLFQWESIKITF